MTTRHQGHRLEDAFSYLLGFDIFAASPQEGRTYLEQEIQRFLLTLDLLPEPVTSSAIILELGANPYFLSLLIQKTTLYRLEMSNYFGDDFGTTGEQTVRNQEIGEEHVFPFQHFNVEKERFPYPDNTFDGVLFCEIIEHLTHDPTHTLCEIHRVLKPHGFVLVTTPNVMGLGKLLNMLSGRKNIYTPYSGYGVYGRHQREYTLGELQDLIHGCGFSIKGAVTENIYTVPWWKRMLSQLRPNRRDHLFVLANKEGARRYYYPSSLYMSQHAIRRPIDSSVIMGHNDIGHIEAGWWMAEDGEKAFRWTLDEGRVYLVKPEDAKSLQVHLSSGRLTEIPLDVTIGLVDREEEMTVTLTGSGWHTLTLPLEPGPDATTEIICVTIRPETTFQPASVGMNDDTRELGVMVHRLDCVGPAPDSSTSDRTVSRSGSQSNPEVANAKYP